MLHGATLQNAWTPQRLSYDKLFVPCNALLVECFPNSLLGNTSYWAIDRLFGSQEVPWSNKFGDNVFFFFFKWSLGMYSLRDLWCTGEQYRIKLTLLGKDWESQGLAISQAYLTFDKSVNILWDISHCGTIWSILLSYSRHLKVSSGLHPTLLSSRSFSQICDPSELLCTQLALCISLELATPPEPWW